ncbi:transcriptional repressor LexA [Vallitalea pronyensis]|uniref:LexA repressor n=1 Tax=Vallitalea pronyensis TaxID=1348613 RepID=A0A8J8SHB8_9FIRM|nr:transcriptional repressor LexA [Vallitalea pronyensis]QUI23426.1 transcriptional repressor LexA [Vallitalea pronyensis]
MNHDLSEKQLKILNFIKNEILDKGYPPAVREICDAVGLKSTSTVHGHLERLEKKGYIRRDPSKPRAIEITDETFMPSQKEMVSVPIIGKVAAGEPLLAVENIDDYFPIPMDYMPNQQSFMLRVQGDSMIDAGIFNEDLILVQQQQHAKDKDIVVALLDDSVTVKRFFKESNHIRLQPENSGMNPIIVDDVTILGKVIGLFRQF